MTQETNENIILKLLAILTLLIMGGIIIVSALFLIGFSDFLDDLNDDWDIVDTTLTFVFAFVLLTVFLILYLLNNNFRELKKQVEESSNNLDKKNHDEKN